MEAEIAAGSKALLEAYVQVQAADLSLMLRKSVEARDWLSTVEPRSVRAVMKRVVEDVTLVDAQVRRPALSFIESSVCPSHLCRLGSFTRRVSGK